MYLCSHIFICICGVALLPFLFAAGAMERLLLENSFYSFCSVATAKNVATAKTVSTQYCWKVGPTRSFTYIVKLKEHKMWKYFFPKSEKWKQGLFKKEVELNFFCMKSNDWCIVGPPARSEEYQKPSEIDRPTLHFNDRSCVRIILEVSIWTKCPWNYSFFI